MVISPQQLTIYLYSAHSAVIFAIAQLSCCITLTRMNLQQKSVVYLSIYFFVYCKELIASS